MSPVCWCIPKAYILKCLLLTCVKLYFKKFAGITLTYLYYPVTVILKNIVVGNKNSLEGGEQNLLEYLFTCPNMTWPCL